MKTSKVLLFAILFTTTVAFLSSCGGGSSENSSEGEATSEAAPVEEAPAAADTVFLTIEGNDLMQFNLKELKVMEGQIVKLTLVHSGQMAVEAMGHNWILLDKGTDKGAFGQAAIAARENDYVPQEGEMADAILAYTGLVGGGEETSVVFTAPSFGYYDYICSFPGHYAIMQGTLVVEPSA
ncbi:MAG: azurin [Bacteroidota bacterium]